MKKVRNNTFETNSSSVHAIVINFSNDINIPKSIHFGIGEFGWEHTKLNSVREKANYLYTALLSLYTGDELQEHIDDIESTLRNAGVENITFDDNYVEKYSEYGDLTKKYNSFNGYIDHYYDLREFIEEISSEGLITYLFNPDSYVHTGHDNNENDYPDYSGDNDYCFIKGN